MTVIRQQAISIIENLPEEKILSLMTFLHGLIGQDEKNKNLTHKEIAFEKLEKLRIKAPQLNYEKELAEYREARFGDANIG